MFINFYKNKQEGGEIHYVEQNLVKSHLTEKSHIYLKKWHVGLTELMKCPDSSNFLNGLAGSLKMQRGGALPVSNFLAITIFFL